MRPESETDVAALIRAARAPLTPVGGASRLWPGEAAGARLHTGALTGVRLYEPAALTLVVRAGTPLAEVQALLASEGQMLGFEPGPLPGSTIGGVVAANASGPRRVLAGACRDALIGVRFVDGQGEIVKNGGRVMKNVTGYDLVKLMAGSRGRLGVLTELSFKTAPLPPVRATLRLAEPDAARAVQAMTLALTGPFDVSGAGWLPSGVAVLRLEGLAGSVEVRADALRRRLSGLGPIEVVEGDADFDGLRRIDLGGQEGGEVRSLWRIVLRPSQAGQVLAALPGRVAVDWGGALIWAETPPDWQPALPPGALARRVSGAGPLHLPAMPAALAALDRGIRARFDPRGILAGAA